MKIANRITPEVIQAATAILTPYIPEISPSGLIAALRQYKAEEKKILEERPYTRKEVADLLGLSVQTVYRMMNAGTLRRIHVGKRAVRIDARSVKAILSGDSKKTTNANVE